MRSNTAKLWAEQDRHQGDRLRLFTAVGGAVAATKVLYAGSYVDVAPSFVFESVTYVDTDRRAKRFFADVSGVDDIIAANATDGRPRSVTFLHQDYRDVLDLADQSFDLLISLYAGFVSDHCTRYLRVGGSLLVNGSHGDAAMASIDDRYELVAVVRSDSGRYKVVTSGLNDYLVPKKPQVVTAELLHERGRGIAYTRSAFAYIFRRIS